MARLMSSTNDLDRDLDVERLNCVQKYIDEYCEASCKEKTGKGHGKTREREIERERPRERYKLID